MFLKTGAAEFWTRAPLPPSKTATRKPTPLGVTLTDNGIMYGLYCTFRLKPEYAADGRHNACV
jgi:hypothetical protein